jgi:hypothetical protein
MLPIIIVIKSKRMRWTEHVASMGEKGNAYILLAGKAEGKIGTPRCSGSIILKMDLKEIGWEGVSWWTWLRTRRSGGLL